jgi:DNA-binding PadR family transcriptional regulator
MRTFRSHHHHRAGRRHHHIGGRPGHPEHKRHRGRGNRPLDYGEMRLLLLSLICQQPRHGYELIRVVEELSGGSYTPSPGVIYPTLSWLEDMGYVEVGEAEGGRKSYVALADGEAKLKENSAALDELLARLGAAGRTGGHRGPPPQVLRAMENLKLALRLRLRNAEVSEQDATEIAAAIDAAVQRIETTS